MVSKGQSDIKVQVNRKKIIFWKMFGGINIIIIYTCRMAVNGIPYDSKVTLSDGAIYIATGSFL